MATLIEGRYELLETLGAGREARIVKAFDRPHDRFVALKIRPAFDGRTRAELLNEARVLLAVPPHPALPLVREDVFDGDNYVVAMDWVDGTDLARLVRDRGNPGLPPSSVPAYLAQAAEALTHLARQFEAAIRLGHRDLPTCGSSGVRSGKRAASTCRFDRAPAISARSSGC